MLWLFWLPKALCLQLILLVTVYGFPVSAAYATDPASLLSEPGSERKKIGLVLSGGGARGAAHIGVIKVLEELRVPIDVVVGTSLGSVVGALYSLGKSPAELYATVSTIDWNRGFIDDLPRARLPLRRKDEEDDFQINFELGVRNFSPALPTGVIQGHSLHLLLKSLVEGASTSKDFNQLPIPFRAITTDIEKSETVVIDSGDLAKALQASMSIPAIYAPVLLNDRLLVDGGVTNNLAVDVARQMGADIVIAVDISTALANRASLGSVLGIVDQLTNVLTRANVEQQLASLSDLDIYIRPDLQGFTATDFGFANLIANRGEAAARDFVPALGMLSLSEDEYEAYQMRRKVRDVSGSPASVGNVILRQNSSFDGDQLLQRTDLADLEEYSLSGLHGAIDEIYASDVFERVDYFLHETENDDSVDIVIDAIEKSWGADTIEFGFQLEDDFEGDNNFNLSAAYTRRAIGGFDGDLRVVGQIGELPGVLVEYFQPFNARGSFFSLLQFENQQFSRSAIDDGAQTGDFRLRRNQVALFAGWQNRSSADVRIGLTVGSGRIQRLVGGDGLDEDTNFREGLLQLQYRFDTLDSIVFPAKGRRLRVSYDLAVEALNASQEYDAVSIDGLLAYSPDQSQSLIRWILSGLIRTGLSGDVPAQREFSQGGILSTTGLRRNTEVGEHAARLSLLAYRPLTAERVQALEYPIFLGASLEAGRVFQDDEDLDISEVQISGSLFAAADTPVGPLYLGVGGTQGQGFSALLSLGLTF